MEHLFDPKVVLVKLRKYLKEDGMVIVGLPNITNWQIIKDLFLGKFEYTDTGLLDNGHIRFFTPKSAITLLKDCGYTPIKFIPTVINFPLLSKFRLLKSIIPRFFFFLLVYHFIIIAKKK